MLNDKQALYTALRTHDVKFDGRFFVGVSSTGIYCRPVCRARTPHIDNCTFYPSAAAAELAGFRPCLKCRPELAPGLAWVDLGNRYAQIAVQLIEQGFLNEHPCTALASRLGISDRHLRRIFLQQFGVSPVEYAQSQRLLRAKRLLMDTQLPLIDVAFTAGFRSLRRFNELFQQRYRLVPSQLRRPRSTSATPSVVDQSLTSLPSPLSQGLVLYQSYRPPYDWNGMLNFLQGRAVEGVEAVAAESYRRSMAIEQDGVTYQGWCSVQPDPVRYRVRIDIAATLTPVIPEVIRRLRHLFDLDALPNVIVERLGSLAENNPGLRLPGCVNSFEQMVRAILGQLVSVRMAAVFASRITLNWGEPLVEPYAGITHLFPTPARLAALSPEALRPLGIQLKRAACIIALAQAVESGQLSLDNVIDIEQAIKDLTHYPGIGSWTANYIAMRVWGWPDIFLADDYLIKQRFPGMTPRQITHYAQRWRPWRSYAVLHLWRAEGWSTS